MFQSLTLVLSGSAGQGLKTIEELLAATVKESYNVFTTQEIMSRIRGGNNTIEIRIGKEDIYAYKDQIDVLFLLNKSAYYRLPDRVGSQTKIFGEESFMTQEELDATKAHFTPLAVTSIAKEAGSVLYSNIVILGFIAGLIGLEKDIAYKKIQKKFASKNESIIAGNLKAFDLGYQKAQDHSIPLAIEKTQDHLNQKILNGTQAISIGAIAGGVNYIASYPMSPATGVLEYLADKGDAFGIVVEQAEDEIAAINMCIGSWYAGARSLVTTSGGGFALMEEGVSLSGITETPAVIHIAQRPGPGTGLPTRTEQGDLTLAVYSGHGEFPRIVLAPGTLEDGILLTQKAFYLADKFQVPVFVLSDQYYLDSKAPLKSLTIPQDPLTSFMIESDKDYLRYKLTENGISPRAIPGYGQGLVKCDSDEHDERGSITEDFNVRIQMNDKRLGKEKYILEDYLSPELIGSPDYKHLIIGWGSTYGALKEAVLSSGRDDLAFLHIRQLFPLGQVIADYAKKAESILVVENNATGQLNNLLNLNLNIRNTKTYLKYNGVPFTVEEIDAKIKEVF